MTERQTTKARRILIVDDNPSIHDDIKQVLNRGDSPKIDKETQALAHELFDEPGDPAPAVESTCYEFDDAYQGEEALAKVEQAEIEGRPYAVVFMDVRMPPGIDGIRTIQKIWERYPQCEIIICTAFSDYTWDQIAAKLGSTDQLLFMKKPFDAVAIKQTVAALSKKWEKRHENRTLVSKLEDGIYRRTAQLNDMIIQFERLKRNTEASMLVKETFLTNRSLQIQTPLNSLIGATELLLDTDLTQEQQVCAENIKSSGDSLLTIVNDILDYSKLEAGDISLSQIEFNIRSTIENVVDLIAPGAYEKGLDIGLLINYDIPENLIGDPLRLRQIVLNYLTNAVKCTESGHILVSISCGNKSSQTDRLDLRVEVSDTGIGIAEDEIKSIFIPVSQSIVSAHHRYANTGLGLAICKRLATLMHGTVGVDSKVGEGSAFWFQAPFEIENSPKYLNMTPSQSLTGVKCLIISDSPTTRKVLTLHINQWGGKCSDATTTAEAIEKLHTAVEINPFDIAIIDLRNKDLDFYKETAQTIRRHRNLDNLRLICLTSKPGRGDARLLKEYGYSAYLTKPIKQSHLYKSLLMIYGLHEQRCTIEQTGIITKHFVDEFAPDCYRVLVVDDDPMILKSTIYILNKFKIRCDIAHDGSEAIEAFFKRKYDMVLIDCEMPVKNGYEAVESIRLNEKSGQRTPIVAITDDPAANNLKKCLDSGMDDQVVKPYEMNTLIKTLKKYLESNKTQNQTQPASQ